MAWFTEFHVKSTLARLEDLCKREAEKMSETSDLPVPRPPPFQNTLTTLDSNHFGTKESLLIVILIGTHAGSNCEVIYLKRHPSNIIRNSGIEIQEA